MIVITADDYDCISHILKTLNKTEITPNKNDTTINLMMISNNPQKQTTQQQPPQQQKKVQNQTITPSQKNQAVIQDM